MEKEMTSAVAQELYERVFALLNEKAEYAVLRNFEGFPQENTSRDIDIVLFRSTWKSIRRDLLDTMVQLGWQLVTLLRSDRVDTWVVAHETPEHTELVQWDFFFDTSVFGVRLASAAELLQGRLRLMYTRLSQAISQKL